MARQINYTRILEDSSSFQLVRTNAKLTGNVKLTIDSNDGIWLNSIDANSELSNSRYKKFAVNTEFSLAKNLYNFFNFGQTPREIVFDVNESFDSTRTSRDYKDQFDFSNYFSGVKYLSEKEYSEKLSYFAPIYLNKEIPEYFVILKLKNPLNKRIDEIKNEYPFDREQYIIDTFSNATLVKTFNLGEGTRIGDYLRSYISTDQFKASQIDVTYEQNRLTTFSGLLYDTGVVGSRGESLYDVYSQSNPLKYFEEFITLGFERNGVIFPNIINMEFVFDDDTSDLYDFDRYVGFYVNAIELTKLDVDLDRIYDQRGTWENTPIFRKRIFEDEDLILFQSNQNGVDFPVKNSEVLFSEFDKIFSNKDNLYFNYLQDKDKNLYIPRLSSPYEFVTDEFGNESNRSNIKLSNTKIDLGKFFGPGKQFLQDTGFSTKTRGFSTQYIKIESFKNLDEIKIYHKLGTKTDSNGNYDSIIAVEGYSETPNPGDFYVYNDIDEITGEDYFYFNSEGLPKELSSAVAECVNRIRNISVKAYSAGEYVFIKSRVAGEYDSSYRIEFVSPSLDYSNIEIDDKTGNDLIGTLAEFKGGSKESGNRLIIDSDHLNKINQNIDDLLVKTSKGWSKIRKVSKYQDLITESLLLTESSRENSIGEYFDKIAIVLEEDDSAEIDFTNFNIYKKHRPGFGLLSLMEVKDFDFDFYSSEYLNFPIIDLYKNYFIPPDIKLLDSNYDYEVIGDGTIEIEGTSYSGGDTISLPTSSDLYSYSVISGDVYVSFSSDISTPGSRLDVPINDQNGELQEFPGFFLLKDPDRVVEEETGKFFELREKYLNGIANSEYDFLKENQNSDFSLKSKIIPYITKWSIPVGTDSRSNPYRLNVELPFGFNNFSPDHEDRTQNPDNFTHEWFYIETKFNFADSKETASLNNSYFDEPFDLNRALTEDGYFIDYFTYTPKYDGSEVGRTQTRYSPISKDGLGEYSAFLKGFRIKFKDYIDPNNLDISGRPVFNTNSNRFEDYRFTSLLKVNRVDINDDTVPPIRYRMIEHKDFKFIILLIEINLSGSESVDDYWKTIDLIGSPELESVNLDNFLDTDPRVLSTSLIDSINGDYRISFENIGGSQISDINYNFLYSIRNKKYNNLENHFSNIKLSQKINLSSSGAFTAGGNSIEGLENTNYPNYPSRLSDEVNFIGNLNFLLLRNFSTGIDSYLDFAPGIIPQQENKLTSAGSNNLNFSTSVDIYDVEITTVAPILSIPTGISANYFRQNYQFKIAAGGINYYQNLFQKISFGEFKNQVNSLSSFIEYESYEYDGTLTQLTETNWYSDIPDVSSISKLDAIVPEADPDSPTSSSKKGIVGYKYFRYSLDNQYDLNRYDGGFAPLFKGVSLYKSDFKFVVNDIDDLDSGNTRISIDQLNSFKIKNFSHIKVSEYEILDLESSEVFDPTYELIDEISIGRADYDILNSNWDYGFHYNYANKSIKNPVSGSLRIEEDDSYISKIVNLRSEIELENYQVSEFPEINLIQVDSSEISYIDKEGYIEGIINVGNVLTRYLLEDGISQKFEEFLVEETQYIGNNNTIREYVEKYIELNILKLYEIDKVEMYTLENRESTSNQLENQNSIQFEFLDDQGRSNRGYKLDTNLQINKSERLLLSFRFNKRTSSGLFISPKIKIKFI